MVEVKEWDYHQDLLDALYRILEIHMKKGTYDSPDCMVYRHFTDYELRRNTFKDKMAW
jgi:hypothetical protein